MKKVLIVLLYVCVPLVIFGFRFKSGQVYIFNHPYNANIRVLRGVTATADETYLFKQDEQINIFSITNSEIGIFLKEMD